MSCECPNFSGLWLGDAARESIDPVVVDAAVEGDGVLRRVAGSNRQPQERCEVHAVRVTIAGCYRKVVTNRLGILGRLFSQHPASVTAAECYR